MPSAPGSRWYPLIIDAKRGLKFPTAMCGCWENKTLWAPTNRLKTMQLEQWDLCVDTLGLSWPSQTYHHLTMLDISGSSQNCQESYRFACGSLAHHALYTHVHTDLRHKRSISLGQLQHIETISEAILAQVLWWSFPFFYIKGHWSIYYQHFLLFQAAYLTSAFWSGDALEFHRFRWKPPAYLEVWMDQSGNHQGWFSYASWIHRNPKNSCIILHPHRIMDFYRFL